MHRKLQARHYKRLNRPNGIAVNVANNRAGKMFVATVPGGHEPHSPDSYLDGDGLGGATNIPH